MANVVLLFGHGSFNPLESPSKATIPTGCRLLLFARHGEEINGERMTHITYWIDHFAPEAKAEQSDLLAHSAFMKQMKEDNHLRRVKNGGEQVHNYRLFPPAGLYHDVSGEKSETGVKLVMVEDENGVPLQSLLAKYGKPGRLVMWVACRAMTDKTKRRVDGYNLSSTITHVTQGDDLVPIYRRENEPNGYSPSS
ncbi:putative adhesin [Viridibacterium curvum]|uniref:Putative adhesin Stv domain-containing protein n=1 Tax=Viridibacterium curvum TaxID=1101404 RepID=A0ABP9R694_9RHOO